MRHQVMRTKEKKQVGTDLYTFEDEAEAKPEAHGVEKDKAANIDSHQHRTIQRR